MKKQPIVVAQIMGKWVGGGVEAVIMNYYRNIDRTKIQFDFICDSDSTNIPYDEIKKLGGKVIICPPYQKVLKYEKFLIDLFKKNNYKIVHSNINALSVFPLRAAKKAGVPIRIAHSHSTTNKKEWKKNLMKQALRPFSKKYATDYFACSELAGRWLFGDRTFEQEKVTIINNAIDLDKFKYSKKIGKEKRKELGIKDDTLVIGHIGRFVAQKNHTFLIDIFNELHKKKKNSILLLIGQGPLMDAIKEKVEMLGISDSVKFLGQRGDVDELYQVFDVFCLPSLYEGLPVVGVEAQATGNLCILSDDMTKETKVLDTTEFLSLKQSAQEWADTILILLKTYKKHNTKDEISKYGFNIENEAKKLEKIYLTKYIETIEVNDSVISFDIYDTLIERILPREKIFNIISEKYGINNFSELRIAAEKSARKTCGSGYSIEDIYDNINLDNKNAIKETEILYEIKNARATEYGSRLYKKYKNSKKIICISDMYFYKETLIKILYNNGFTRISEVYVSSEFKCSKKWIKLFKKVKNKLNNNKIVHYGDSIRSDFINPILVGIKAKYIKKNDIKNNSKRLTKSEYLNYIGYHVFGPMIFEFCIWINSKVKDYKNLIFVSREGEVLNKCYNQMYGKKCKTIFLSRSSVIVNVFYVSLKNEEIENLVKSVIDMNLKTVMGLVNRLGLNNFKYLFDDEFLKETLSEKNITEFINIIYNNKQMLIEKLSYNYKIFSDYLASFKMKGKTFIDVGWNGTIQKMVNDLFSKEYGKIKGLYLGALNLEDKDGFLFNNICEKSNTILNYSGLLELIFMPPHGSVKGYYYKEKHIEPLLEKCEFSQSSKKSIKLIQDGFIDYISDRKKISNLSLYNKIEIYNLINKIGIKPQSNDINYLGSIDFYDNGENSELIDLKNGFAKGFKICKWKIGFLKKYFVLNLPYNQILNLMRKFKK